MPIRSLQGGSRDKQEKSVKKIPTRKGIQQTDLGFFSFCNSVFYSHILFWKSFSWQMLPQVFKFRDILPKKPFYKLVNTQHSSASMQHFHYMGQC